MVSTVYGAGGGGGGSGARSRLTAWRTGAVTGGGAGGAPSSAATAVPLVSVKAVSSGLRSVSVMRPTDAASEMRSASSGVTSSVTTEAVAVRPSAAGVCSARVPAASTSTLLTTTRAMLWSRCEMVTTASTCAPGPMKPATPTTSSTFTEIARMPAVIIDGRPATDPAAASLAVVMGSFSTTDASSPQSTAASIELTAPLTGLPAGQVVYSDTGVERTVPEPLVSHRLGLIGKPDYLVEVQGGGRRHLAPVEVKSRRAPGQPPLGHVLQLMAYCLLVEETYRQRPPHGVLRYADASFTIPYTDDLRAQVLHALDAIRQGRRQPDMPRSHDDPWRCRACGYRSACGDEALGS